MRGTTIPRSGDLILRKATLEGSDRRLPRPRHATVPRPRHLHCERQCQCWTRELEVVSIPVVEASSGEKPT